MSREPRQLPPLNAVRAFEVAARHLSFSRAADELGVTPGAVSKQVLALEDFIGARLFERLPEGLAPTLEGRELAESLTPAFELMAGAFQRFSRRPPRSNVFRLSTVASLASQFIVPRLDRFEARLPQIELEILTSDRLADLAREEIDLSIRFGGGIWDSLVSRELTPGRLAPVCAPDLLAQHGDDDVASILAATRLIRVFPNNEWLAWADATGAALPQAAPAFTVMEHFLVAMQAAMAGQGAALLPEIIVRDQIAKGGLARFAAPIDWGQTFYLAYLPDADRRPMLREMIDWLTAEAQADIE